LCNEKMCSSFVVICDVSATDSTKVILAEHDDMIETLPADRTNQPFDGSIVESRCGAVAVGRTYLFPPLSSGGASLVRPWLRFHTPLIEPDMRSYRIRLSDKTSRLHPRHVVP
jgi:hypothetical protein